MHVWIKVWKEEDFQEHLSDLDTEISGPKMLMKNPIGICLQICDTLMLLFFMFSLRNLNSFISH